MSPTPPLRFLFTGGGTGGHVTPALAVSHALHDRHPDASFLYVGVRGRAEQVMVPRDKVWKAMLAPGPQGKPPQARLELVRSRAFTGPSNPVGFAKFCIQVGLGTLVSLGILLRFRPHLVVATGGYASAPVVFATWILRHLKLIRSRVLLHEQNAKLGLLNKLAARLVADSVGTCFPKVGGVPAAKLAMVGYPVRASITELGDEDPTERRQRARDSRGIPRDAKVVFAFGGSQGARTINRAIVDSLPKLLADPRVWVIHGTGRQAPGSAYSGEKDVAGRLESTRGLPNDWKHRYHHEDFIYDMRDVYAASDLVVCRGGAGSLKEAAACGLPAVVIPKANVAGEHQAANARAMEQLGAARVLYERIAMHGEDAVPYVDGDDLAGLIAELLADPAALQAMGKAGHADFEPRTLDLMAGLGESLVGLGERPRLDLGPAKPDQANKDRDILPYGSNQLTNFLQAVHQGRRSPLTDEERRLALYKIDGLLAGAGYVSRCRGCRSVGWAGYEDRLPVLVAYATAKRGDRYRQLPLVRRDAFVGLGLAASPTPPVLEALDKGLHDPYFEARSSAAQAVARIAERSPDHVETLARLIPRLCALVHNRCFESRMQAVLALGEIGTDPDTLLPVLHTRRYEPNWRVRAALYDCLRRLAERKVISAAVLEAEASQILSTATGYTPRFSIKQSLANLHQTVADLNSADQPRGA